MQERGGKRSAKSVQWAGDKEQGKMEYMASWVKNIQRRSKGVGSWTLGAGAEWNVHGIECRRRVQAAGCTMQGVQCRTTESISVTGMERKA